MQSFRSVWKLRQGGRKQMTGQNRLCIFLMACCCGSEMRQMRPYLCVSMAAIQHIIFIDLGHAYSHVTHVVYIKERI